MSHRYTRIILISDDEQGVREFTISHRLVWLLGVLALMLAGMTMYLMISYGGMTRRAAAVPIMRAQLDAAELRLARVAELERELQEIRGFQERLLLMLGITPAPRDSLDDGTPIDDDAYGAAGAVALGDLAAMVMTPPPDTWPAAGYITREYIAGDTVRGVRPHPGLDIAGPEGAPILAAGDGTVTRAGSEPYLGNFVEIQHGLGYVTVYGHCQRTVVVPGQQVRRGQEISSMGQTGEATAPHLHFEIWHNGTAVDPRGFLAGEPASP
jgi:murein DD-endopeptidase MepM/ murein hydrolase activator NlpD